jgi:AraC-like DNA-binding protein
MTLVLDTNEFALSDRAEVVREAIASTMVPVEIAWPDAASRVAARGVISNLGPLTVCSIRSTATVVERTPQLARDDLEPSVFLGLQVAGSSVVVQGDREVVLAPGSLVIYDSTAPYTLIDGGGVAQHFFRIPHSALALPHNVIRDACAVQLSPGHPVSALTACYLNRLAADPALFTAPNADVVARPSIELIRAVIATHLNAEQLGREPLQASLRVRILEYVHAHLADPDLGADRVAAAHYISVRYLYKLLAEEDISLASWIRHHRLEMCRNELARCTVAPVAVADVARKWGFTDMSSFSRSFRTAYGLSPRQWRNAQIVHDHRDGCAGSASPQ